MESTWIVANSNARWLLGGLWEMFMHRLGSRCSCGVCLRIRANFWLSTAAELSVTLRVTERLTPHSGSFPFPLSQVSFFILCFAVPAAKPHHSAKYQWQFLWWFYLKEIRLSIKSYLTSRWRNVLICSIKSLISEKLPVTTHYCVFIG